jgi:hypothetical protein
MQSLWNLCPHGLRVMSDDCTDISSMQMAHSGCPESFIWREPEDSF